MREVSVVVIPRELERTTTVVLEVGIDFAEFTSRVVRTGLAVGATIFTSARETVSGIEGGFSTNNRKESSKFFLVLLFISAIAKFGETLSSFCEFSSPLGTNSFSDNGINRLNKIRNTIQTFGMNILHPSSEVTTLSSGLNVIFGIISRSVLTVIMEVLMFSGIVESIETEQRVFSVGSNACSSADQ